MNIISMVSEFNGDSGDTFKNLSIGGFSMLSKEQMELDMN